jgi:23S rRNA (cytidine1920-2'-O)/16S rRNA (cytidine1409-2'-O)-methyltransferase
LLIHDGAVVVNEQIITKPSYTVKATDTVTLTDTIKYVSRAGLKLEHALRVFEINPEKMICLDIGSSTGGFTDCLLQHHAAHVDAVDVGTNQLVVSLRNDERVHVYEQTDIRNFQNTQRYDLIVCDASFISLTKIIPELPRFIQDGTIIILLIKPQFEVGKDFIGKGGIVDDELRVIEIITDIVNSAQQYNLKLHDEIKQCPVTGGDGNQEYLACFTYHKKSV